MRELIYFISGLISLLEPTKLTLPQLLPFRRSCSFPACGVDIIKEINALKNGQEALQGDYDILKKGYNELSSGQ